MRMPTQKQRPRTAKVDSFPAPTGGLISNRNLAMGRAPDAPPGASVLENMFPMAASVIVRKGSKRWASLEEGQPIKSLFTYLSGSQRELFAASDAGIWNITTVPSPYSWALAAGPDEYVAVDPDEAIGEISVEGLDVFTGTTSGDWIVAQYATSAGAYLIGVNGVDEGFIYDGTTFYPLVAGGVYGINYSAEVAPFTAGETLTGGTSGATATIVSVFAGVLWVKGITGTFQDAEAITDGLGGSATEDGAATLLAPGVAFPGGYTKTTADLSYVWIYKQRVWFIEKNSLDAWYLPVDQIGGELTLWPMGGIFTKGGTLVWGEAWSLDSGGSGGLSEQCVFTTTEGEVAAYQGLSPEPDQGWTKVGVYRIGKPLGKKAFIRAGGDLVIATSVGFISLAMASKFDYAALGANAVSYPIEDYWAQAIDERGLLDWKCEVWADGQMVLVAPPTPESKSPVVFVSNANTGKWATFTGWDVSALRAFNNGIFFGSNDGAVRQGWVGGSDEGIPYVAKSLPLFSDMGAPASLKVVKMARAVTRSTYPVKFQVSGHTNFKPKFPAPPSQAIISSGSEWDNGTWGESLWDAERGDVVTGDWVSVGGSGHDIAIGAQFTSGTVVPIDAELIRMDVTFSLADAGT